MEGGPGGWTAHELSALLSKRCGGALSSDQGLELADAEAHLASAWQQQHPVSDGKLPYPSLADWLNSPEASRFGLGLSADQTQVVLVNPAASQQPGSNVSDAAAAVDAPAGPLPSDQAAPATQDTARAPEHHGVAHTTTLAAELLTPSTPSQPPELGSKSSGSPSSGANAEEGAAQEREQELSAQSVAAGTAGPLGLSEQGAGGPFEDLHPAGSAPQEGPAAAGVQVSDLLGGDGDSEHGGEDEEGGADGGDQTLFAYDVTEGLAENAAGGGGLGTEAIDLTNVGPDDESAEAAFAAAGSGGDDAGWVSGSWADSAYPEGTADGGDGGAAWPAGGREVPSSVAAEEAARALRASPQAHAGDDGAAARAATRPRVTAARAAAAAAPAFDVAAAAAVVFPGSDLVARIRRGLVAVLWEKSNQTLTFAELGIRMARHPQLAPAWRDPASRPAKLKDLVEAAVAAAPGVLALTHNEHWNQWVVSLDPEALRRTALRRAVAAAYPGSDDVSVVRRAAAAALAEAESGSHRHSLPMPALGQLVIQTAGEARQRLAAERGAAFSLGAVLSERPAGRSAAAAAAAAGGQPGGYIVIAPLPGTVVPKLARLEVDRLLQDAASGRLGDLAAVVQPRRAAAVRATAAAAPAAAASTSAPGQGAPATISPNVKAALRAAIPESRPEALAKRALALVAAASLGATNTGPAAPPDPPFSLRSSPVGILLGDLQLKPPKGQMRALFDEEPNIFMAGKPSANYLITLVHGPLRELAAARPAEVAASVAALLRGKNYPGLRLRAVDSPSVADGAGEYDHTHGASSSAAAAATAAAAAALQRPNGLRAPAHPAAASPSPSASTSTSLPTTAAPALPNRAARRAAAAATYPEPPAGQPADYYPRLEAALDTALEEGGGAPGGFLARARRAAALALLRLTHGSRGGAPHCMPVKEVAAVLKREFPEAYQDKRPPGVFPVNALVLAQQLPTLFKVSKMSSKFTEWTIRLNIHALETIAGLAHTAAAAVHAFDADADADSSDISEDPYAAMDAEDDAAAAAAAAEPPPHAPPTQSAAEVAAILSQQPARALAVALAPTIPPDVLAEPELHVITVPYSTPHVTALAHCLSCPQIGLAAKSVGGSPVLVLLYAPGIEAIKPAAAKAAAAGTGLLPAAAGVLAAAVYVFDVVAAGPGDGAALLGSLRGLLEDPGVAKVVHGCEQLVPSLELAIGCPAISPLLDSRVVSEMLKPLDLNPPPQQQGQGQGQQGQPAGQAAREDGSAGGAAAAHDEGTAPGLWPLPSQWQATLTTKYWDYQVAALQHASGADSCWLTRPLTAGQLGMLSRAVQHLPELWSALTWLLPRLAQFVSVARAGQCREVAAAVQQQEAAAAQQEALLLQQQQQQGYQQQLQQQQLEAAALQQQQQQEALVLQQQQQQQQAEAAAQAQAQQHSQQQQYAQYAHEQALHEQYAQHRQQLQLQQQQQQQQQYAQLHASPSSEQQQYQQHMLQQQRQQQHHAYMQVPQPEALPAQPPPQQQQQQAQPQSVWDTMPRPTW